MTMLDHTEHVSAEVREAVITKIRELDSTANEIANSLAGLGITGRRSNPALCPIANYLRDRLPDGFRLIAVRTWTLVKDLNTEEHRYLSLVGVPGVLEFIAAFDNGEYPHLIKREVM